MKDQTRFAICFVVYGGLVIAHIATNCFLAKTLKIMFVTAPIWIIIYLGVFFFGLIKLFRN
jgi:hypothetical protein